MLFNLMLPYLQDGNFLSGLGLSFKLIAWFHMTELQVLILK